MYFSILMFSLGDYSLSRHALGERQDTPLTDKHIHTHTHSHGQLRHSSSPKLNPEKTHTGTSRWCKLYTGKPPNRPGWQ